MQPLSSEFRQFIGAQLPELADTLIHSLENTSPSVALRLNPRKGALATPPGIATGASQVPWWRNGRYLPSRPDFTHDPAMHQGLYYVQDASSMILAAVVEHLATRLREAGETSNTPLRYLDACAAPGGKTTAAIDALPDGTLVVANEFDFRRAEILKENIMKWGYPCVAVSRGDTARFRKLPEWFDIVAADVPCSGEGMMRKDETARTQWSTRLVAECAALQREILQNLWPTLRPGGFLIYSTCTFNTLENEANIAWLTENADAIPVRIPLPDETGIITSPSGAMRFLPSHLKGEGLFMAVLQKPGTPGNNDFCNLPTRRQRKTAHTRNNAKNSPSAHTTPDIAECTRWLNGDFCLDFLGETLHATPAQLENHCRTLLQNLDIIHQGVALGNIKGRTIIPHQGLALSSALNADAFPCATADTTQALAYLRREAMPGYNLPKGPLLLTHGSHPLGFVNNLGNRANNLYPQQWRILH